MSATTSTNYEETEKSWEGDLNIYLSRTGSVEIYVENKNEGSVSAQTGDLNKEIFRTNLVPLFTFMKQKLKNVNWEEISRTRDRKWGYKRIESDELFDLLSRTNLT